MGLQIFQHGSEDGDRLMQVDRDLLERAAAGSPDRVLRFYTWKQPTISLGYHQREDVLDLARMQLDGMPWTRRPTGGAAVLHSEELTYAIVACLDGTGGGKQLQSYVSLAIGSALRSIGVPAEVDERGEPLTALPNRISCFVRTSRWEVTVRGRKLVGSAQRRLGSAYLQHGSILTGPDHLRIADYLAMRDERSRESLRERLQSHSTTVADVLGHSVDLNELRQALANSFENLYHMLQEADVAESSVQ